MAFDITDPTTWGAIGALGLGALAGSANGSSQAGTTTQTAAPWEPQQPYLQDIFSRAQGMSGQPGVSQDMSNALGGMYGALNNPLNGQAQGVISNTLNTNPSSYYGIGRTNPYQGATTGQVNNPYLGMDNPYLKQSVDNASQAAMRNLMPAFNQAQNASGSFGNSGVADTFGRAAADQLGTIANNAYMNQFNTNLQATGQQQQFNAGLNQADLARNSQLAQQGIANDINQYNQGQSVLNNAAFNSPGFNTSNMNNYGTLFNAASLANNAQWNPLNNYSNLVRGTFGGTTTTPYYSNPVGGAIGGAVAGSTIYNNLFGKA